MSSESDDKIITLSDLKFIKAPILRDLILTELSSLPPTTTHKVTTSVTTTETSASHSTPSDPPPSKELTVIDVRTGDYVDGHLPFHRHVPSTTFSHDVGRLVEELRDTKKVVFHCALSQERGPRAALMYLRHGGGRNGQEVFVLEKGFVGWQEKYGKDKRLTPGWEGGGVWEYM